MYAWGYGKACGSKEDILSPAVVYTAEGHSTVAGLVGGDSHSLLLLNNGKLFSWGNNYEVPFFVTSDFFYYCAIIQTTVAKVSFFLFSEKYIYILC